MARERIRVDGRNAWMAAALGIVAGIGAAVDGPRPTGGGVVDAVLVVAATTAVVWCAASAHWWVLGSVALGLAAATPTIAWLLMASTAAIAAGAIGAAKARNPWARAAVAGAITVVAAHLGEVHRFGWSSVIGVGVVFIVAVSGATRRPRDVRRQIWVGSAGLVAAAFVSLLGFGVAAASARPDLERGVDKAHAAIDLLSAGDYETAARTFAEASSAFDLADDRLGRPWGMPAGLIPVVAQHRSLAVELSGAAAGLSDRLASVLLAVDLDALRVTNGRVDIAAIEALAEPLAGLQQSLEQLDDALADVASPWLVDAVRDEIDELSVELAEQRANSSRALEAVRLAPAMLGGNGVRRYFVGFTSPVELRGSGGLMSNYTEITIDQGQISFTAFGRHLELDATSDRPMTVSGPADFLDTWGDSGFTTDDGGTRLQIWGDVTTSPHFPSVGQVVAELYPQSGGPRVDGVFMMDVYALAGLMQVTGDVQVPDSDLVLTAESAVDYITRDQYEDFDDFGDRVDALEAVATETMQRLLSSDLPSPPDLADVMSPFVHQGRLLGWSADPGEQALLGLVGMDGALPTAEGHDVVSIAFNNAGNDKLDLYMSSEMAYDLRPRPADRRVDATLTVHLANDAPSGLPLHVLGNTRTPPGNTVTMVTVHSALVVSSATIDGEPMSLRPSVEAGLYATSFFVALDPGERASVELEMSAEVDDPASFVRQVTWRTPPTMFPPPATLSVDGAPIPGSPITMAGVTTLG